MSVSGLLVSKAHTGCFRKNKTDLLYYKVSQYISIGYSEEGYPETRLPQKDYIGL